MPAHHHQPTLIINATSDSRVRLPQPLHFPSSAPGCRRRLARTRSRCSAAAMSPVAKNLLVSGSLGAFCVGAYVYTMRAVGRDDLDGAIAKREAAKASAAAAPPAKK
jgi:hypothetical protein